MPNVDAENAHTPVLLNETLKLLGIKDGGLFVDATLGLGGHSEAVLESTSNVHAIGIDQDKEALKLSEKRLAKFGSRISLFHSNFAEIKDVIAESKQGSPDGILADLGVSSLQLDSETRGFSFRFDSPLDMRMNPEAGRQTAAEFLADVTHDELANVIYKYGEERASRKIARLIIERRERGAPVKSTFELADLVKRAVRVSPKSKTHPATRTFQALRIAVNGELDVLERFLADSVDILKTNGVLAVITFHSLEDGAVKRAFRRLSGKCQCPPRMPRCICGAATRVEILTRKPILPTEKEQRENPRSRSAKLRACRKLEQ
jgi:16S rRNA (cytosine1402-N4)-methyltransferase